MSDDIPERDAEDVLRVIRDDAGRSRAPAGDDRPAEVAENGTFLLTSVHRIEGADAPGPEARRTDDPIPFKRPPWQRGDGARPAAPQKWSGPAAPSMATLGDKRAARGGPTAGHSAASKATPPAVPGLEDPSDGTTRSSRPLEKPEPLQADPRAGSTSEGPSLDEASIRRIVEDVLDERLQGELGRRITRSVKQIVRREVARTRDDRSE